MTTTQAHKDAARRIWDAGHNKIAGQAADASWVAEQAHIETLAEHLAAAEAELVEALLEARAAINGAINEFGEHPAWANAVTTATLALGKIEDAIAKARGDA